MTKILDRGCTKKMVAWKFGICFERFISIPSINFPCSFFKVCNNSSPFHLIPDLTHNFFLTKFETQQKLKPGLIINIKLKKITPGLDLCMGSMGNCPGWQFFNTALVDFSISALN